MKVVIDTNVMVSAALCAGTPRRVVLYVAEHERIKWLVTKSILFEYLEVLRREKLPLSDKNRNDWIDLVKRDTHLIATTSDVPFPRDPADAKFLNCALDGGADYLITGDKDFSEIRKIGKTTILSAALFERLVVQRAISPP